MQCVVIVTIRFVYILYVLMWFFLFTCFYNDKRNEQIHCLLTLSVCSAWNCRHLPFWHRIHTIRWQWNVHRLFNDVAFLCKNTINFDRLTMKRNAFRFCSQPSENKFFPMKRKSRTTHWREKTTKKPYKSYYFR